MTAPQPGSPPARRGRLVGLLVLGIAVVLLVSSVTWFGSDRAGVGIGQVLLGVVLAALGAFLVRRGGPRRPSGGGGATALTVGWRAGGRGGRVTCTTSTAGRSGLPGRRRRAAQQGRARAGA